MDKAEEPSLDFLKKYAELRTVLDSLEVFALQYCLKPETNNGRIRKINGVIKDLQPLIRKYGGAPSLSGDNPGCEPGYCNCYGVCVPYQCP
ncbi:MAG TPA: hypothetical protein VL325_00610 [Pyrinomonadaceae bacterium]|jgi:hypothetical protein|nr:hypothetical protein [Pyrinomonadaceae bacterium]